MPSFQYEALDETGKPQKGSISAGNSEEAIAKIRSQGYFPTSVREQKAKKQKSRGGGGAATQKKKQGGVGGLSINIMPVSSKQLTQFTRQLSTLQDAGLPILRSVAVLEEQEKPGLMKDTLGEVHEDVSSGSTLSDAMNKHPRAFDRLYTKMVAAGEVGGVLDVILQRLAEFLEKSERLRRRIKGAMIYPAVVLSVAFLILAGIMLFIVPSFMGIFEDFDTTLPIVTVWLTEFAGWLGGPILVWLGQDGMGVNPDQTIPGLVWVLLAPFGLYFFLKLIRKSYRGKYITDWCVMYSPIAGKLVQKATIAKFTRTLGTLINAGVPILDAITITADTTSNEVYARTLRNVHDSVRQGESFGYPLRQAKVCDAIVVNMIDVGEETGDLDKMLNKIADNYDEEVDVAVAGLVSLLEPVMIVILGGIVGFIVLSLFLPMISIMESLM